jgi:hypothetical protein
MKRWILALAAVLAVTLGTAATASAQGYGPYGCGVPYSTGYHGGYGGYAPTYNVYRPGYGGLNVGYGGLHFSYGGAGWHDTSHYDYHPATVRRHWGHYDYVPGHYHLHRTGHPHW